jgi:hypothetical protein
LGFGSCLNKMKKKESEKLINEVLSNISNFSIDIYNSFKKEELIEIIKKNDYNIELVLNEIFVMQGNITYYNRIK